MDGNICCEDCTYSDKHLIMHDNQSNPSDLFHHTLNKKNVYLHYRFKNMIALVVIIIFLNSVY